MQYLTGCKQQMMLPSLFWNERSKGRAP